MAEQKHPLDDWRMEIDRLDDQVLASLARRRQMVLEIGRYKKTQGLPPFDQTRWQQVLESRKANAQSLGLCPEFIEELYHLIHKYSLSLEEAVPPNPNPSQGEVDAP